MAQLKSHVLPSQGREPWLIILLRLKEIFPNKKKKRGRKGRERRKREGEKGREGSGAVEKERRGEGGKKKGRKEGERKGRYVC